MLPRSHRMSDSAVSSGPVSSGPGAISLSGQLEPGPRSAMLTTVLGLTGILVVSATSRIIGKLALGIRQPATFELSTAGLHIKTSRTMLGRVLSEKETLVPIENLAEITREDRFPRLGLYAGLFTLAFGTYAGVGMFIDGIRVPGMSPSLIASGALLVAFGLALDFGINLLPAASRKVRVLIRPRVGKAWCLGDLDPTSADQLLASLADQAGFSRLSSEPASSSQAPAPESELKAEPSVPAESDPAETSE